MLVDRIFWFFKRLSLPIVHQVLGPYSPHQYPGWGHFYASSFWLPHFFICSLTDGLVSLPAWFPNTLSPRRGDTEPFHFSFHNFTGAAVTNAGAAHRWAGIGNFSTGAWLSAVARLDGSGTWGITVGGRSGLEVPWQHWPCVLSAVRLWAYQLVTLFPIIWSDTFLPCLLSSSVATGDPRLSLMSRCLKSWLFLHIIDGEVW
jgi:hypothetical protein